MNSSAATVHRERSRLIGWLTGLLVLAVTSTTQATTLGEELVANGDAETGDLSGWVTTDMTVTTPSIAGDLGLPAGVSIGNWSFWGSSGPSASQSMSQTIDISGLATEVDGHTVQYSFSALIQSRRVGGIFDEAKGQLRFLDANGAQLAAVFFTDTSTLNGVFDWELFSATDAVPSGTRSLQVFLDMSRTGGGFSTDALFDNVSLRVSAVPEASGVLMLVSGLASIFVTRRRNASIARHL